jgi:hypothetical protein
VTLDLSGAGRLFVEFLVEFLDKIADDLYRIRLVPF